MNLIFFTFLTVLESINANKANKVVFPNLPLGVLRSSNNACSAQTQIFLDSLENSTLWAHQMWDASAKSTTGVLQGNAFQMGDYDECMKVEGPFKTQFCFATITAKVPVPENLADPLSLHRPPFGNVLAKLHRADNYSQYPRHTVHVGMCVPASCSRNDFQNSLNDYLKKLDNDFVRQNVAYSAVVADKLCQTQGRRSFDGYDIGFCVVTAILLMCAISSSVYDNFATENTNNRSTVSENIFLAFSLKRNFLNLLHNGKSNPAFDVFNGMKVFCICMIIIDHRLAYSVGAGIINMDYIEEIYRSWTATYFYHGDLFVDTFFTLSGILLCYGLLVQFEEKIINPGFLIFLRYIRLTPAYAFVIFLYATVLYHMDSGPVWELFVGTEMEDCRMNWWTNLIYVNNYVNSPHMCMVQSWYLPCDFHFFIIGIFLVFAINKNKPLGFGLLLILLTASLVVPFILTVIYSYPAVTSFIDSVIGNIKAYPVFYQFYIKSHNRATSYFVGIFTGYVYYKWKDSDEKLPKIKSHCITAVSIFLLLAAMLTGTILYDPYHEFNAIEIGSYAALHRLSWALGTAGLLFTSSHGCNKYFRNLLSWSGFVPLGKLVYSTYLIHLVFQIRDIASIATPIRMSFASAITTTLGDMVVAFAAAMLLFVFIENPIRKISKELFFVRKPTKEIPVVHFQRNQTDTKF